jgi:hypothetical protein
VLVLVLMLVFVKHPIVIADVCYDVIICSSDVCHDVCGRPPHNV